MDQVVLEYLNALDLLDDKEFERLKLKKDYFICMVIKKEFGYNRIIY